MSVLSWSRQLLNARVGTSRTFTQRSVSAHDHLKVDAVAAVVKVVRG
jgi:hypothetical protein